MVKRHHHRDTEGDARNMENVTAAAMIINVIVAPKDIFLFMDCPPIHGYKMLRIP